MTAWSIQIDTYNGDFLDCYETTAANRAEALRALYTAAIAAADDIAADRVPLNARYTLDLDQQPHTVVVTGDTDTGEPDHAGARASLEELRDRYCNTN